MRLSWSPCDPSLQHLCAYTWAGLRKAETAHMCATCPLQEAGPGPLGSVCSLSLPPSRQQLMGLPEGHLSLKPV